MQMHNKLATFIIAIFIFAIILSNKLHSHDLPYTFSEKLFSLSHSFSPGAHKIQQSYSFDSLVMYKELKTNVHLLNDAEKNSDLENINIALINIGCLYAEMGNYSKGLEYFQKLKSYGVKYENKQMLFYSHIYSGEIYSTKGQFDIGLENYFKALKYSPDTSFNVLAYCLISQIYIYVKNYRQALFYITTAGEIADKSNNRYLKFISKYFLSKVYLSQNKYKKSLEILSTALTKDTPPKNSIFFARTFTLQGQAYYHLNKFNKALSVFSKALKKGQNENETVILTLCYTGYVYIKLNNYAQAYTYLQKANINNNITAKNIYYSMIINKGFSNLYYAQNKYKEAYKYRELYETGKNKIDNHKLVSSAAILSNRFINTQILMLKENILVKNRKLSTANVYNILLIIISSLIFIMLILFFYLYFAKKRYAVRLSQLNNSLDRRVKERTIKLKQEIEEKSKLINEIKIASDIQQSILPKITDKFKRPEFTLYAELEPALNASGDFYDFFYINKNILAFVIADVSGKGISAAFFMTFAKTVLLNSCLSEKDPAAALSKTNKILSTNNVQFMFVTAFLCYYNIKTGDITYANAGHHDAIIVNTNTNNNLGNLQTLTKRFKNMSSDKSYQSFGYLDNIPLGFRENSIYNNGHRKLDVGESILCYTDGVTEAYSPSEEIFGENRLYKLLQENINLPPQELVKKVISDVKYFEKENRFDDITVLLFKRDK